MFGRNLGAFVRIREELTRQHERYDGCDETN